MVVCLPFTHEMIDSVLIAFIVTESHLDCVHLCRYWEAMSYWDEALTLNPHSAKLYEMKSQVRRVHVTHKLP